MSILETCPSFEPGDPRGASAAFHDSVSHWFRVWVQLPSDEASPRQEGTLIATLMVRIGLWAMCYFVDNWEQRNNMAFTNYYGSYLYESLGPKLNQ